jgi:hypothetical protein
MRGTPEEEVFDDGRGLLSAGGVLPRLGIGIDAARLRRGALPLHLLTIYGAEGLDDGFGEVSAGPLPLPPGPLVDSARFEEAARGTDAPAICAGQHPRGVRSYPPSIQEAGVARARVTGRFRRPSHHRTFDPDFPLSAGFSPFSYGSCRASGGRSLPTSTGPDKLFTTCRGGRGGPSPAGNASPLPCQGTREQPCCCRCRAGMMTRLCAQRAGAAG